MVFRQLEIYFPHCSIPGTSAKRVAISLLGIIPAWGERDKGPTPQKQPFSRPHEAVRARSPPQIPLYRGPMRLLGMFQRLPWGTGSAFKAFEWQWKETIVIGNKI